MLRKKSFLFFFLFSATNTEIKTKNVKPRQKNRQYLE